MQVRKSTLAPTLALASAAAGVSAFASGDAGNDARILLNAGISLSQAVSAAEQQVGGTACEAEVEQHAGQAACDAEVVKGPQVFDVNISPDQGTVIASTQDRFDHDGHDPQDCPVGSAFHAPKGGFIWPCARGPKRPCVMA